MAGWSGHAFADVAAMHHQSFKWQAFLAVKTIYMFTGCVFLSIIYVLSKYITFNDQGFILLYTNHVQVTPFDQLLYLLICGATAHFPG